MREKFRSKNGFTLSEMLMTVLILLLVTSVIAGGIAVVRNVYLNVTLKAEAQTLRSTAITEITGELRYAQNIDKESIGGTNVYAFDSPSRGYRMYFKADTAAQEIIVHNLEGTEDVPLLTEQTSTDKLQARITEYEYDVNDKEFKVKVVVYHDGHAYAGANQDAIIVRPLNLADM